MTSVAAGSTTPTRRRARRTQTSSRRSSVTMHVIAIIVAALYAVPMLYVVVVALSPSDERTGSLPSHLVFGNFVDSFTSSTTFPLFFANSVVVAVAGTIIQVCLSCAAGYGLAMLPVRGRNLLLLLLVALLVVPAEVVMVPLFVMVTHVPLVGGNDVIGNGGSGLLDSLPGLVVPHIVSALAIFLMRQFYASLPAELGNAARVDGAGELRIFASIYTPLVKPAIGIVAVFAFQGAWNDFVWPLVITHSNDLRTLQLGLTVFFQENSTQWNLLMAAIIGISIPVIVLFLAIQRFFQSGALGGALK